MSTTPFSRPGAVDLSALKRPAGGAPGAGPRPGSAASPAPGSAGPAGSYAVEVAEENFQQVLEASMNALVLMVFYSRTQMPASAQLADDLTTLADEFEGKYLLGRVDVDAVPQIAQAVQIPTVPYVVAVVQGRPMPLFQEVAPIDDLRAALTQVMQQLATQGVAGRHQPLTQAMAEEEGEELLDPRYAPAQDALAAGDLDGAVAEYQKLVDANPADVEAAGGLAMAKVLQRTQGADLAQARQAAADQPEDVDAQTLVADLDLAGGHVDDAFARLVDLVRRTSGDDRDRARTHLLGLFAAVGNDDPRVLKGRRDLASALF
ncbi:tetratricopeptide repeat protein [Nocardioides mesophilus]|uniref:Tetratricopeptide repeat protein n=1 Tax=Nocardioides mesophilus TaxID=433659 RepID=A0A7G9R8T2_9ACTN|nr:tetratricopeptide repeat protein [Nocardioides mesophilus]QNN52007.1 tetratricopeptide repeat protein [Nocardioides mesophilus]